MKLKRLKYKKYKIEYASDGAPIIVFTLAKPVKKVVGTQHTLKLGNFNTDEPMKEPIVGHNISEVWVRKGMGANVDTKKKVIRGRYLDISKPRAEFKHGQMVVTRPAKVWLLNTKFSDMVAKMKRENREENVKTMLEKISRLSSTHQPTID